MHFNVFTLTTMHIGKVEYLLFPHVVVLPEFIENET